MRCSVVKKKNACSFVLLYEAFEALLLQNANNCHIMQQTLKDTELVSPKEVKTRGGKAYLGTKRLWLTPASHKHVLPCWVHSSFIVVLTVLRYRKYLFGKYLGTKWKKRGLTPSTLRVWRFKFDAGALLMCSHECFERQARLAYIQSLCGTSDVLDALDQTSLAAENTFGLNAPLNHYIAV